ncbi:conserved Plasmodium protein, unknown function [Plasmodium ovale]|uniref:Uncharacterized protein n=2 Tax=Plasmodium ovale TaxID=36330 RepID=A0A1A8VV61_PLAOA|nr:conserved Plasmodium protein, unknown function [Plasmodium ovale curtisi]SBS90171.1 conserved Plasmodium protein, unknown function [Plasmodium ovale curtisi]SCP04359.1 conserved Plasmodium protein, unknown function [Plasmodium ovale]
MIKILKRHIYYSCEKKKYFTNRLYKKVCNNCLSLNINNISKCVYCDNLLNDNDIRLIKNTIFTDIINVRKNWKGNLDGKNGRNFLYTPLLNNIEIDDKYVHIKNGFINNCNKLYVYYNCYDYIILSNPYSNSCINLIVLFKGITYDVKNLKRNNIDCLLHMYNYIYFVADVFLYFLIISKGKCLHYKYMYNKSTCTDIDNNEDVVEILFQLNNIIKEKKKSIVMNYVHNTEKRKIIENVNETNIIEKLNESYTNIYKDVLRNVQNSILRSFFKKLEDVYVKNKIKILKKYMYVGCSYPSPINHFSLQIMFPPFANYNFFSFPFYFPIQKILHDLYVYGHVKNYNHSEIIKNLYNNKLIKEIKEGDSISKKILHF